MFVVFVSVVYVFGLVVFCFSVAVVVVCDGLWFVVCGSLLLVVVCCLVFVGGAVVVGCSLFVVCRLFVRSFGCARVAR